MELLKKRFKKFTIIVTPDKTAITKSKTKFNVHLSARDIRQLTARRFEHNRGVNLRLGQELLANKFPSYFKDGPLGLYQKGIFAAILKDTDPRMLSKADREAITKYVTDTKGQALGALDVKSAYKAARDTQLLYVTQLVREFESELQETHNENWWQTYFSENILFFQESYIRKIEKLNVAVANTKFPDFLVITSDDYLDIIEIKTPKTDLLKQDKSRGNFYWSPEVAKAISQVENYIDRITKHLNDIRSYLRDEMQLELRIIKPRGIVIAGQSAALKGVKMSDDFRLLNEGLKNVEIVPYDDLATRLENTAVSIQKLADARGKKPKKRKLAR